jgi:hypothetical protein
MPFIRAGGIAPIDQGNPSRFLVSGWGAVDGHLAVVQLTDQPQPTISTLQAVTIGSSYPIRVCWTDQTIFLVDAIGQKIVSAPWDGVSPLPTSFTDVIDKSELYTLAMGSIVDLAPAAPDGVLVTSRFGGFGGLRVYWNGSAWATEDVTGLPAGPVQFGPKGNFIALPSTGPLIIQGPVGAFSIIDDSTGTTVGSGVSTSDWEEVTVTFASELTPGQLHRITSPGIPSNYFTPTVRHGTPKVVSAFGVTPGLAPSARLGNLGFGVATRFPRADSNSYEVLQGSLWIAVRDSSGNDSVVPAPPVPPGATAFLVPAASIEFLVEYQIGDETFPYGIGIPLPNDPILEGLVLLFQFVAIVPGGLDFVISDVFGVTVLSAGSGGDASGGRVWATMSSEEREAALKAGLAWLGTLNKRLPGHGRSVYEMVQSLR